MAAPNKPPTADSSIRETARSVDTHGRALEDITKLLMKLQTQETMAVEKVLAGQGNILNHKIKEIDDRYRALHLALRAVKETMSKLGPVEQARAEFEKREAKLQADRAELEHVLGEVKAREEALAPREKEVAAKLTDLDIVKRAEALTRRAQELDEQQRELESRFQAYTQECTEFERRQHDVEREWEKLVTEKSHLTQDLATRENLMEEAQRQLNQEMTSYRSRVKEEVIRAFQASVLDLIRNNFREEHGP